MTRPNFHQVGVTSAGNVIVGAPPTVPMTASDALDLAAWLAVTAHRLDPLLDHHALVARVQQAMAAPG